MTNTNQTACLKMILDGSGKATQLISESELKSLRAAHADCEKVQATFESLLPQKLKEKHATMLIEITDNPAVFDPRKVKAEVDPLIWARVRSALQNGKQKIWLRQAPLVAEILRRANQLAKELATEIEETERQNAARVGVGFQSGPTLQSLQRLLLDLPDRAKQIETSQNAVPPARSLAGIIDLAEVQKP